MNLDQANVVTSAIGNGVMQYSLFVPGIPQCLGFVQVREYGDGKHSYADVDYSYVLPDLRRSGIRTALQKALLENNALIYTNNYGSSKSGIAWMKANGYKLNKVMQKWYLKRP